MCRSISALTKHIELLHPLERVPSACVAADLEADSAEWDHDAASANNGDEAAGRTLAAHEGRSRVLASLGLDVPTPPLAAAVRRPHSIDEGDVAIVASASSARDFAPRRASGCVPKPEGGHSDADEDDEDADADDEHEDDVLKKQEVKQLTCTQAGCGRAFATTCGLRAHLQLFHERACARHSAVRHRSEAFDGGASSSAQHALLAGDTARVALAPVFSFTTQPAPILLPSSVLLSTGAALQSQGAAATQQQPGSSAPGPLVSSALLEKRSRTRITEEHLRVLRAHFNLNCSPGDEEMAEMSARTGLPVKVIKHWFRNTLFKERQRSKDSPYNFSIPPVTSLNLEEYARTGELPVHRSPALNMCMCIYYEYFYTSAFHVRCAGEIKIEPLGGALVTRTASCSSAASCERDASSDCDLSCRSSSEYQAPSESDCAPASLGASFTSTGNCPLPAGAGLFGASGAQRPLGCSSTGSTTSSRAMRTRFSPVQLQALIDLFARNPYPSEEEQRSLSRRFGLNPRVVRLSVSLSSCNMLL